MRSVRRAVGLLAVLLFVGPAYAQRSEVHTSTPAYNGETASAPIPPSQHIRNEGGSDGSGLCVISSILANGMYQQVPGLESGKQSALWRAAKSRPGGYYPEKLRDLVNQILPNEKWASYYGPDTSKLDKGSSC